MSDIVFKYYKVNVPALISLDLGYLSQKDYISQTGPKDNYIPKNTVGKICVRIERPPLASKDPVKRYNVSYSFCSPTDQFKRSLARKIASGREKFTITSDHALKAGEIADKAIDIICNTELKRKAKIIKDGAVINVPNWVSLSGRESVEPYYKRKA